jgi:hypothetical protein
LVNLFESYDDARTCERQTKEGFSFTPVKCLSFSVRFIAEKVRGFTVGRPSSHEDLKNLIGNNLNMNSRYRNKYSAIS